MADDFSVTQHVQRLVTSSAVLRQTTRFECCAVTIWATRLCSSFIVPLSSLVWLWRTLPAHDAVSPKYLMVSASTQWLTAPDVSDTARRTYRRSMNSTTLQTTDYSITLFDSCRPTAPPFSVSQRYNMRHRAHSLQLPEHSTLLSDSNFLTRMLYKPHISPDVSLPI